MTDKAKEIPGREDILNFCDRIGTMSPAEILQVTASRDRAMIRKAYLEMAKNYHPDRFHGLRDAAIEEKAAIIFKKINEAYAIMSSDDAEVAATARPAGNPSGAEWAAGKRAEQAKLHYRKGRYWMNRGDYRRAVESFRGAVELGPEEAEYNGWFADALERTGRMLHLAEEHCKKAIALDPDRAEHYVRLGRIYRRGKLDRRAEVQFRRALRIDSQNGEAKHELGVGKPVDRERGLMAAIIRTAASLGGTRARVDARAA